MSEYKHGEMDITDQEEQYDAFWRLVIRSSVLVALVLILMYAFLV